MGDDDTDAEMVDIASGTDFSDDVDPWKLCPSLLQLMLGRHRRRWPGSVPAGIRVREDSALTEVGSGCCPHWQAAAACKLRGSPRPEPQQLT